MIKIAVHIEDTDTEASFSIDPNTDIYEHVRVMKAALIFASFHEETVAQVQVVEPKESK